MLPFEHWHMGRQWVAKMIAKTMSVNANLRGDGNKLEPWGFKHPRTALLVPFWHGTLADKFLYIHVLRDGKDIVEGDNQKVFNDHCSPFAPAVVDVAHAHPQACIMAGTATWNRSSSGSSSGPTSIETFSTTRCKAQ